jgi:hypothetical protein
MLTLSLERIIGETPNNPPLLRIGLADSFFVPHQGLADGFDLRTALRDSDVD